MTSKATQNTAVTFNSAPGEQDGKGRVLCIRMTMMPNDTNGRGRIFGGRLLELMDLAGAYIAHRVCKDRFLGDMVTRVTKEVQFTKPVQVNDSITAWGSVISVGNTSATVRVEVEADRAGIIIPVTSCIMVFVNVDANDNPVPIHAAAACDTASGTSTPAPAPAKDEAATAGKDDSKSDSKKTGKKGGKKNKNKGKKKSKKKNKTHKGCLTGGKKFKGDCHRRSQKR